MKTAIVIGATGLVGSHLVDLLLQDNRFSSIKTFTRRSTGKAGKKLEEHIIDFDKPEMWRDQVKGDALFSALGTTLKQAGGQQAQYKIDHTYQFQFAEAAAQNGVPAYVLVSSASASPDSRIFYSRMKGELERDVKQLPFGKVAILQPGLLVGEREEPRLGEEVGEKVLSLLSHVPGLGKLKPIAGKTVAKAMINASLDETTGTRIYALDKVFELAGEQAG